MEEVSNNKFLLVGLGNPGLKYNQTRHNVGFMFIDYLAKSVNIAEMKMESQFNAEVCKTLIFNQDCVLIKPHTYMNLSGDAVIKVANFYKIERDKIIIFYDDLDLNFGKIRLRTKSGDGGHNGIKSIRNCLGNNEFINFRFGIGRPENINFEISSWVLSKLSNAELVELQKTFELARDVLETLLLNGLASAQSKVK